MGDLPGVIAVSHHDARGQQGLDHGVVLGQLLDEDGGDVSRRWLRVAGCRLLPLPRHAGGLGRLLRGRRPGRGQGC